MVTRERLESQLPVRWSERSLEFIWRTVFSRRLLARWGFGCEPASGASIAGAHKLIEEGIIGRDESVACILTGHELKDPNVTVKYHTGVDMKAVQDMAPHEEPHGKLSNRPVQVEDDLDAILRAIGG